MMDLPLANARANIPPVEVPQIQSKHCDVGTPHTFYLNKYPNATIFCFQFKFYDLYLFHGQ